MCLHPSRWCPEVSGSGGRLFSPPKCLFKNRFPSKETGSETEDETDEPEYRTKLERPEAVLVELYKKILVVGGFVADGCEEPAVEFTILLRDLERIYRCGHEFEVVERTQAFFDGFQAFRFEVAASENDIR